MPPAAPPRPASVIALSVSCLLHPLVPNGSACACTQPAALPPSCLPAARKWRPGHFLHRCRRAPCSSPCSAGLCGVPWLEDTEDSACPSLVKGHMASKQARSSRSCALPHSSYSCTCKANMQVVASMLTEPVAHTCRLSCPGPEHPSPCFAHPSLAHPCSWNACGSVGAPMPIASGSWHNHMLVACGFLQVEVKASVLNAYGRSCACLKFICCTVHARFLPAHLTSLAARPCSLLFCLIQVAGMQ